MRVVLVSALRDEGPYVLEWLAHHRALGVTDFLLFTNDCADGTDTMLDALADFGVVRIDNAPPQGKSLQWNALKAAWAHPLRKSADWMLCLDSDEFINVRAPLVTFQDLINATDEPDAIILPWRLFGHAGQQRIEDALSMETFTRAAPPGCDYPVGSRQYKTLFRTRGPFAQIGVHRPRAKKSAEAVRWADGSGQPMPDAFAKAEQRITLFGFPEATALVQLNHYSIRSAESFMLKRQRGLPNRRSKGIDLTYWVERNFNTVADDSILRLVPRTRAVLDRMLEIPGMAALQATAIQHHRDAFDALMQNEAEVKLFGRLLLSASSTPLDPATIRRLVGLFRASQR